VEGDLARVHPQHGEIVGVVGADHLRRHLAAGAAEADGDLTSPVHHVGVRQDVSLLVEHEARACGDPALAAEWRVRGDPGRLDERDAGGVRGVDRPRIQAVARRAGPDHARVLDDARAVSVGLAERDHERCDREQYRHGRGDREQIAVPGLSLGSHAVSP
jgi:hypothetical protein